MKPTGDHSEIPEENRILKCHIVLNHKKKDFRYEFEGEWRGRDVKVVINHLFREYRRHLQSVRKIAEPKQAEPGPTPPETEEKESGLTFMAATGQPPMAETYTDRGDPPKEETPPVETIEEPSKKRGRRKKEENVDVT